MPFIAAILFLASASNFYFRRLLLYPDELRAQKNVWSTANLDCFGERNKFFSTFFGRWWTKEEKKLAQEKQIPYIWSLSCLGRFSLILRQFAFLSSTFYASTGQVPCGCDKPNPVRSGRKQRSVCSQRDTVSLTFFISCYCRSVRNPSLLYPSLFFVSCLRLKTLW